MNCKVHTIQFSRLLHAQLPLSTRPNYMK